MPTVPQLKATVVAKKVIAGDVVRLTFETAASGQLPAWEPGSHVDLLLPNGVERQYSLCGSVLDHERWSVAVLRDAASRGGSAFIHDELCEGDLIRVTGPRNNFPLVEAQKYRFVAGGIGIAPILPMVQTLTATRRPWTLLYGGRRAASMAFVEELRALGDQTTFWPEDECGLLNLSEYLVNRDPDTAVYCCGPSALIRAVEGIGSDWPDGALHLERFRADPLVDESLNAEFELLLRRSSRLIHVAADQSIVEALEIAGIPVESSCREGTCGTCETRVIEGVPDHRDTILTRAEKDANDVMMICCSRSKSARLVLDL